MPYLARLGVSHVYLSPITEAVSGSSHGYDVTDPMRLRDELGGEAGFERLAAAARRHGLRLLIDVVPNHMATDAGANPYWRDVLEDGRQSPHAAWFDIDWEPPDADLRGRVMVPILAESLDATIDAGELTLARMHDGGLVAGVPGAQLPLSVAGVASLISAAAVQAGNEALAEIGGEALLLPGAAGSAERYARHSARELLRRRLATVCVAEPAAGSAVDEMLASTVRDRRRLRALVDSQVWFLDGWRQGSRRLNYRRFFTISSLVGVRAEVPEAAATGVQRVLRLVTDGIVDGLRIDHIDGLRDPAGYLTWLRQASGGAWVVVEKILAPAERMPPSWAADGTTGYEFGALLVSTALDPHGLSLLEVLRDDVAGPRPEFAELVRTAKLELLANGLAPEWARVLRALDAVTPADDRFAGFPAGRCHEALREMVVALGVYRTYVGDDGSSSVADRTALHGAAGTAGRVSTGVPQRLLAALADVLGGAGWDPEGRAALLAARVQQLAPALMAKGVEDAAIYRDASLLARNEVGCDPDRHPAGPGTFHAEMAAAHDATPLSLLATSTHDTKRSEDVRARLCVLSELASTWASTVRAWAARHRELDPGGDAMLVAFQTLVGAWPVDADRLHAYLIKAMREASERTSWIDPDTGYETRLRAMVDGLFTDAAFVGELEEVVRRVRPVGELVSLAWTLLRLTAPGVPDTYQGTEIPDLSLVDPDNRRPVDYARREALLRAALEAPAAELQSRADEGLPKLAVVARALGLRQRHPELFGARGAYRPLPVTGPLADHVIAFSRGSAPGAVTVAPRLPVAVEHGWRGTVAGLPEGRWRDLFSGETLVGGCRVELDRLLAGFPVALLERVTDRGDLDGP